MNISSKLKLPVRILFHLLILSMLAFSIYINLRQRKEITLLRSEVDNLNSELSDLSSKVEETESNLSSEIDDLKQELHYPY